MYLLEILHMNEGYVYRYTYMNQIYGNKLNLYYFDSNLPDGKYKQNSRFFCIIGFPISYLPTKHDNTNTCIQLVLTKKNTNIIILYKSECKKITKNKKDKVCILNSNFVTGEDKAVDKTYYWPSSKHKFIS